MASAASTRGPRTPKMTVSTAGGKPCAAPVTFDQSTVDKRAGSRPDSDRSRTRASTATSSRRRTTPSADARASVAITGRGAAERSRAARRVAPRRRLVVEAGVELAHERTQVLGERFGIETRASQRRPTSRLSDGGKSIQPKGTPGARCTRPRFDGGDVAPQRIATHRGLEVRIGGDDHLRVPAQHLLERDLHEARRVPSSAATFVAPTARAISTLIEPGEPGVESARPARVVDARPLRLRNRRDAARDLFDRAPRVRASASARSRSPVSAPIVRIDAAMRSKAPSSST